MKGIKGLRQFTCHKCKKSLLAKNHAPICECGREMILGGYQAAKTSVNPIKNSKRTSK